MKTRGERPAGHRPRGEPSPLGAQGLQEARPGGSACSEEPSLHTPYPRPRQPPLPCPPASHPPGPRPSLPPAVAKPSPANAPSPDPRPTPGGPPLPHLPTRPPAARQLCRAVPSPSPSDPKTETGHVARAREGADRPLHWLACPLSRISGSPHLPGPRSEVSTVLRASCLPRPWFPRCGSSSHKSSTAPPAAVQPLWPCGIFPHTHQTSQEGRAGPSPPSHTQGHCTPMRAGPRWAPTPLLLLRPGLWCRVGLTLLSPPVLGGARLKPELHGG